MFEDEGKLYVKSLNKWWDGYEGEEIVCIDDFEDPKRIFGWYLKTWAD